MGRARNGVGTETTLWTTVKKRISNSSPANTSIPPFQKPTERTRPLHLTSSSSSARSCSPQSQRSHRHHPPPRTSPNQRSQSDPSRANLFEETHALVEIDK